MNSASKRIALKRVKDTAGDRVFNIINMALMVVVCLVILYPLYFVIIASFSSPETVNGGGLQLLPKEFYLSGYKRIFSYMKIWQGYANSLYYTTLGTAINIAVTLPAAFALSRKTMRGRNAFMLLFSFTMFFGGGLIPTYLLIKNMGIQDTVWALVLPGAASVWNIIVTRTFIQTNIPESLFEAARIDGANDFQFFFRIVIPLSKAIIAVMILFYAMGHWNNYFSALVYMDSSDKYPLQLVLQELLVKNQISSQMSTAGMQSIAERAQIAEQMKYGVIIVASLPMMILYPFVQKYFEKGMLIGSIKG
jgi:putative aldouronate transport system permease protein